jgi:hypothetical protein
VSSLLLSRVNRLTIFTPFRATDEPKHWLNSFLLVFFPQCCVNMSVRPLLEQLFFTHLHFSFKTKMCMPLSVGYITSCQPCATSFKEFSFVSMASLVSSNGQYRSSLMHWDSTLKFDIAGLDVEHDIRQDVKTMR